MDTNTTIREPVLTTTTEKVNPILKRDQNRRHQDAASKSSPPSSSDGTGAAQRQRNRDDCTSTLDREKKHLTWDEHAIEEHDLLRGTRMKIEEPDTPYTHYDNPSDEESNSSGLHPRSPDENHPEHAADSLAAKWNDVSSKLQAVADKRNACPLSPAPSRDSNMSDTDEEPKKQKDEQEKKFKDMRKKHYNEAEMMKRWRAQHATDDDDSDEDKMEE